MSLPVPLGPGSTCVCPLARHQATGSSPRIYSALFIPSAPQPHPVPSPRDGGGIPRTARGVLSTQAAPPPAPRSPRPDPGMGWWGGSRSLKPFGPSQPLGKLFLMQLFCRQDQKGFAMGGGWLIFYQVTWKITFWQGSTSRTPIRSLVGRNQEQHLIPMEIPGGITPESETLWHEETPQHTIPLGLLVQHVRKNSEETRDLGHPRTCSPLQPQLWVLLNTPFPPKTKPPHHSFRSQPQLPVERPWDMGGDKALPSSPSFRDGLSSLAEFCSRLPEILCPRLGGLGVFRCYSCNKRLQECKSKPVLACSVTGHVASKDGSELRAGTEQMEVEAADAGPGAVPVCPWHRGALGRGSAGRRLLEMSAGLNAAEK